MGSAHSRMLVAAVAVVAAVALPGCARIVTLSAEEEYLPPCETTADIDVQSLDGESPPTCAPYGSYLVFPDGKRMLLREDIAVSSSGPTPEYTVYYFGSYGLAASFDDGESVEWWSHTEKALELGQYLSE